jgi:hypothetical protein
MSLPRYRFFRDQAGECYCDVDTHPRGEYVSYTDHAAMARELQSKLDMATRLAGERASALAACHARIGELAGQLAAKGDKR